jgi:DNA-binding MarR family transcriptional regulator
VDAVGLTYTQYIALVALSEEDEQTASVLGEKLFLESNTLTPFLNRQAISAATAIPRTSGRCT